MDEIKLIKRDNALYKKWNKTTAMCFLRNCKCGYDCPNFTACRTQTDTVNEYRVKNIKYAALMTFCNIGREGLDRYE